MLLLLDPSESTLFFQPSSLNMDIFNIFTSTSLQGVEAVTDCMQWYWHTLIMESVINL